MLTDNEQLLISDAKRRNYKYDNQTGYFESVSERMNAVHRIYAVYRVRVLGDGKLELIVQQYSKRPHSQKEPDLQDSHKIIFEDNKFKDELNINKND